MNENMSVERLLSKLEEQLLNGKKQMFSNMRLVDANTCMALIQQIKASLPQEINNATIILRDCEKIKDTATREAESIISAAQEQARYLVSQDEITKSSEKDAKELVLKAATYADQLVEQSYSQVNNMYIEVENAIRNMLNIVMENRASLFTDDNNDPNQNQQ